MSEYHHLFIFTIGLLCGGIIGAVGIAAVTLERFEDD